jgi:hypothetical protein
VLAYPRGLGLGGVAPSQPLERQIPVPSSRRRRRRAHPSGRVCSAAPRPTWREWDRETATVVAHLETEPPVFDIAALKKQGVEKLFTPGTPLQDIVDWLRKRFPEEKR